MKSNDNHIIGIYYDIENIVKKKIEKVEGFFFLRKEFLLR